ncbi:MAG: hypothetical protein ACREA8_01815, partial [Nitrosotalea sp.]
IVIMVTADMTVETESMLTKLNASTLVYKPYDINKIMEIIKKMTLEKTSQTKQEQVSSIHA